MRKNENFSLILPFLIRRAWNWLDGVLFLKNRLAPIIYWFLIGNSDFPLRNNTWHKMQFSQLFVEVFFLGHELHIFIVDFFPFDRWWQFATFFHVIDHLFCFDCRLVCYLLSSSWPFPEKWCHHQHQNLQETHNEQEPGLLKMKKKK